MKSFSDYVEEYEKAIGSSASAQYVVKRPVWILSKWEDDNHLNPWDSGYLEAMLGLKETDPELLIELAQGFELAMKTMQEKGKGEA